MADLVGDTIVVVRVVLDSELGRFVDMEDIQDDEVFGKASPYHQVIVGNMADLDREEVADIGAVDSCVEAKEVDRMEGMEDRVAEEAYE